VTGGASALRDTLFAAVAAHCDNQFQDDTTLLVMKRQ